jgi:ribosomal protein L28
MDYSRVAASTIKQLTKNGIDAVLKKAKSEGYYLFQNKTIARWQRR